MLAALCGLLVVGMAKGGGLILLFATSSLIFVVLFTIDSSMEAQGGSYVAFFKKG